MALRRVSMAMLDQMAETADDVLSQVRTALMEPHPRKLAPEFSSTAIADLCGVDKKQIKWLTTKHNLPSGTKVDGSKAKTYSLEDAITWVQTINPLAQRPANARARILCTSNYKGGVAKTSTTVAIAQALTLRGLKVLIVDCDGQGTATQLCGISPEHDVEIADTIMPFIYKEQADLRYAVQPTYWHNLSVIPASSAILSAEFALPGRAMKESGFRYWEALRDGLEPIRDDFDVIIIDTSPSLSYLTINVMIAADAIIMPCPPESLDFASSVQFWGIFSELLGALPDMDKKTYDFVTIVYTKVKQSKMSGLVKSWMEQAYGAHINGIEIPDSEAARMAAGQLKTIYDLSKPEGNVETYRRYKDPLDRLANYVFEQLNLVWSEQ